ncbi:MAG TPA: hypothetical protein VG406_03565 [Isosphaeraceae bacterium]|jgi:hypothetical protein|nr:hypothetical protein [Isosphaeraceae bacterium]
MMIRQEVGTAAAQGSAAEGSCAAGDAGAEGLREWESRHALERYRAGTERLRVLVEFLGRPVHAHGGAEPDPDIVVAYNLAVEAALQGIRRAACDD